MPWIKLQVVRALVMLESPDLAIAAVLDYFPDAREFSQDLFQAAIGHGESIGHRGPVRECR